MPDGEWALRVLALGWRGQPGLISGLALTPTQRNHCDAQTAAAGLDARVPGRDCRSRGVRLRRAFAAPWEARGGVPAAVADTVGAEGGAGERLKLLLDDVGYASESALSWTFKAQVGVSPREWRTFVATPKNA